ncbi:hypothetical protein [Methylocystis rosea]|jgi:hypothetical protein|uniref:Uncharacterized protein n=1 Tax=Methylocystis rosea TaxID=173366 RepID=A0A3G8M8M6_9HYPH|nr:hypothetical protein [Methylocystis rosea]AZG78137.1 hypothetical protein EHO51_16135 [Methylocystis rosea]
MNAPTKGSPIEIVLADNAGRKDVLRGVLLGRFDGDHVEVKFDDLPFKAIVDRRLVRKLQAEGEAS